ncbi:restriction endonuclease subunit S [Staphylococcus aureus]|uniref:restriction endonuclease subunit S n=1 Tax=Staphylococcus aureus TaxID=1280 RepID=UPI003D7C805E
MSNTQKKNVPELRFPGFEGEWEEKKVGELLEFKNGLNKGKEYFGSGSSIVNFKDVFNNRSINTNNLTGKVNVNSKELKNYSVEKGDVFFTRTSEVIGEIGYPSVILNDPENTVFSGFVLRGRPKSGIDLINNNFKRYVFFTNSFRKEMITKSSMTTRALTSGTAINRMKVIYPVSAKEQKKIGDFFSKLDRQIELEEQKLELLQQQKKGYMQKIFSQELRFKDENGNDYPNWRTIELKNILENIVDNRGKTPDNAPSEKYPLLEVNALGYYRPAYIKVSKFVSENTYNNWFREHLKENDILFSTVGNTGIVSLMDNYKAVIAQNIVGLRVNNNNLPSFIYYMLSYKGNQKKIKRIQMGGLYNQV